MNARATFWPVLYAALSVSLMGAAGCGGSGSQSAGMDGTRLAQKAAPEETGDNAGTTAVVDVSQGAVASPSAMTVSAADKDMGNVAVGATRYKTLKLSLSNWNYKHFLISGWVPDANGQGAFRITSKLPVAPVANGQRFDVTFAFTPPKADTYSGTIRIRGRFWDAVKHEPHGDEMTLTSLTLTAAGITAAVARLTTDTYGFPNPRSGARDPDRYTATPTFVSTDMITIVFTVGANRPKIGALATVTLGTVSQTFDTNALGDQRVFQFRPSTTAGLIHLQFRPDDLTGFKAFRKALTRGRKSPNDPMSMVIQFSLTGLDAGEGLPTSHLTLGQSGVSPPAPCQDTLDTIRQEYIDPRYVQDRVTWGRNTGKLYRDFDIPKRSAFVAAIPGYNGGNYDRQLNGHVLGDMDLQKSYQYICGVLNSGHQKVYTLDSSGKPALYYYKGAAEVTLTGNAASAVQMTSAYRCPQRDTSASREIGHDLTPLSRHTYGCAIDIHVPGTNFPTGTYVLNGVSHELVVNDPHLLYGTVMAIGRDKGAFVLYEHQEDGTPICAHLGDIG